MIRNILLLFVISLLFIGCQKFDKTEVYPYKPVKIEYTERIVQTYPSIAGINIPIVINTPAIDVEFNQEYTNTNPYLTMAENIKPIRLVSKILQPVDANFDFLKNKKIYIRTDNQPEILLGHVYNLPNGNGNLIDLVVEDGVLLDDYIFDPMYMRIEVIADQSMLEDIQVEIFMTVTADVKN